MTPRAQIAHYKLTAKVGEGGMGAVYRATDTKLNREVAIKVLPPAFAKDAERMARFEREAQVLASLNHPSIASIFGVEESALVMELVEGPDLAERLAAGPIPVDEAIAIARQIVAGIEAAHEKNIIHRDLKPANIKITPEGVVKLLDFGLAKSAEESAAAVAEDPETAPTLTISPTSAGVILGTAAYMSPEQARGAQVDKRSDIWGFGVVLYEMLAGKRLFTDESISDILAGVLRADPDWNALPAATPPRIRKLLRRCLERDRKQRLQAIGEARIAIDGLEEGVAARPPGGRLRTWMAATAILAIAVIILSAVHFRERPQKPALMRFQLPSVETLSPAGRPRRTIALSPDGRQMAFIAPDSRGQIMLWVRALDSLEARVLPGTESASHPFWSPDGRHLAFFTAVILKTIDVSGGPAQTVCSVSGIHGGDWNREGVILLQRGARGGLARVSQTGGEVTTVTKPDDARGEIWHGFPQFLPDGRHFLYFAFASQATSSIYLGSLDGKERKRILNAHSTGVYFAPSNGERTGYLLFLRGDVLMAQPADPATFEFAGDAVPIASGVGSSGSEALVTVSGNGVLAYRSGSAVALKSPLTWLDRTGRVLGELTSPGYPSTLALSRDGTRAAFSQVDPQSGNTDIWIVDTARGVPNRFTFNHGTDRAPVWSPDGRQIAFESDRDGLYKVYWKDSIRAGDDQLLLTVDGSPEPTDWSSDGQFLLYWSHGTNTGYDLWVLQSLAGDPAQRKPVPYLQTPYDETQGQFRPEAAGAPHWVAYTSNESGSYEVYVQSFPIGSGKYQVSSGGGTQPRWRRDGNELFYLAGNGKLMAVNVAASPAFSYETPRALFDAHVETGGVPQFPLRYDVSLDGKRFLVVRNPEASVTKTSPITIVVNWTAALRP